MQSFKDNNGKSWPVEINVAAVKRVRDLIGVDLYALADPKALGEFVGDVVKLVDTVYVLCREEADKAGITDEQFGRALGGDSLEQLLDAFASELYDFFPNPRAREALKKADAAGRKVRDRLMDRLEAQIDGLDGLSVDSLLTRLSASSGGSPGSSASTPGHTPSASST